MRHSYQTCGICVGTGGHRQGPVWMAAGWADIVNPCVPVHASVHTCSTPDSPAMLTAVHVFECSSLPLDIAVAFCTHVHQHSGRQACVCFKAIHMYVFFFSHAVPDAICHEQFALIRCQVQPSYSQSKVTSALHAHG